MNYLRSRLVVWLALGAGIALTFLTGFFLGRSQPAVRKQASSNDPRESVINATSRIAEVLPTESNELAGKPESTQDQAGQFENALQAALGAGSELQREFEVCKLAMSLRPVGR